MHTTYTSSYARLIAVHLGQTHELKTEDPVTWQALEEGGFVVTKSSIPSPSLFVDQALERKMRELEVVGGVKDITQNEKALNRYFLIAPELIQ